MNHDIDDQRLMATHWAGVHKQQLERFCQGFTDGIAIEILDDLQRDLARAERRLQRLLENRLPAA